MARTQQNRQAELITPLGPDVLLFYRMMASEGVSELFDYDLLVLSEDENIALDALVGQHAHVELELPNDDTRYFCGHVTRFSFLGFHGNLAKYRVELKPWLWFLTRGVNNRIFQNETVPDIIKAVCAEHGFTDIDDKLSGSYAPREYCVQYRESDFDFISRLMEDEGIYYFFKHEPGKHELVLADGISAHEPYGDYATVPWFPPDQHGHRERDHLDNWQVSKAVRSGKYTLRDFNFETPRANLEVKSQIIREIEHAEYEVYDYPGGYQAVGEGENYVRLRMEETQADFEILRGSGNARGMQPGFLFELEEFAREDQNREYLILAVSHDIAQDSYGAESRSDSAGFNYSCSLQAMPSSEIFRPMRHTVKPIVHGPQTAIVVGEAGEEIWTDQYGRIKVQFHWDRLGENNENSSCWVRVSQFWAGKQWGAQFIPRIGQEVVVEFLEGDPDRPIVTGSVYNADNRPPFELPANATQSGIKTRSSKGGTSANYNEIRFEDKKGSEVFYLHAEKDRRTGVENNDHLNVGVDRSSKIGRDEAAEVGRDRDDTIARNLNQQVGVNRQAIVGKDEELIVGGQRKTDVDKDNRLKVGGHHVTEITKDWEHSSAHITMDARKGIDISAALKIDVNALGGIDMFSPGPINITSIAGVNITHNPHGMVGIKEDDVALDKYSLAAVLSIDVKGGLALGLTNINLEHKNIDLATKFVELKDGKVSFTDDMVRFEKALTKIGSKTVEVAKGLWVRL